MDDDRLLGILESHSDAIGKLMARGAVHDFLSLHIFAAGLADRMSPTMILQAERVIELSRAAAEDTDDPECADWLLDQLQAAIDRSRENAA